MDRDPILDQWQGTFTADPGYPDLKVLVDMVREDERAQVVNVNWGSTKRLIAEARHAAVQDAVAVLKGLLGSDNEWNTAIATAINAVENSVKVDAEAVALIREKVIREASEAAEVGFVNSAVDYETRRNVRDAIEALAGVPDREKPRLAEPTPMRECADGLCDKGCAHMCWACPTCNLSGGYGSTREGAQALADAHNSINHGVQASPAAGA